MIKIELTALNKQVQSAAELWAIWRIDMSICFTDGKPFVQSVLIKASYTVFRFFRSFNGCFAVVNVEIIVSAST